MIVEHEQKGKERAGYAEKTLAQLSAGLTAEYGHGYSRTNLEYMRKFFLLYKTGFPSQRLVEAITGYPKNFFLIMLFGLLTMYTFI
jgi:hypothetical protein